MHFLIGNQQRFSEKKGGWVALSVGFSWCRLSQQRFVSFTEYKAILWKFSLCMNVLRALFQQVMDGMQSPTKSKVWGQSNHHCCYSTTIALLMLCCNKQYYTTNFQF
jgi:hypothetical protein